MSDGGATANFSYDAQNRLTVGYDRSYAYDPSGRLTQYEGVAYPLDNTFPAHAVKSVGATYDANGNLTRRFNAASGQWQQLVWDHENRLAEVQDETSGQPLESYRYDPDGQRIKKTTGSVETFYLFPHYEVSVSSGATTEVIKYYFFNGQRVAMRKNDVLSYLHTDHLGSTLLATDTSGNVVDNNQPRYYAYGRERLPSVATLPTDHTFTGQKQDATGLMYFNARYYDPSLGQFISPDALVPDPMDVMDYNRYMGFRGNPLKYTDPNGRQASCMVDKNNNFTQCGPTHVGAHTVDLDENYEQPPCQHVCGDPAVVLGGLFIGSMLAPFAIAYAPELIAAATGKTATTIANTACADGDCTNEVQSTTPALQNAAAGALQSAMGFGSKLIESATPLTKIESQLTSKANLLGIRVSGNMSSLDNPQVQNGLRTLNSITSNPDRVWQGTWMKTPVYEYIDTTRGIGVVLDQATGQLISVVQRTDLSKLESFVQNGTAQWLK